MTTRHGCTSHPDAVEEVGRPRELRTGDRRLRRALRPRGRPVLASRRAVRRLDGLPHALLHADERAGGDARHRAEDIATGRSGLPARSPADAPAHRRGGGPRRACGHDDFVDYSAVELERLASERAIDRKRAARRAAETRGLPRIPIGRPVICLRPSLDGPVFGVNSWPVGEPAAQYQRRVPPSAGASRVCRRARIRRAPRHLPGSVRRHRRRESRRRSAVR